MFAIELEVKKDLIDITVQQMKDVMIKQWLVAKDLFILSGHYDKSHQSTFDGILDDYRESLHDVDVDILMANRVLLIQAMKLSERISTQHPDLQLMYKQTVNELAVLEEYFNDNRAQYNEVVNRYNHVSERWLPKSFGYEPKELFL